jgi:hypothetical protein
MLTDEEKKLAARLQIECKRAVTEATREALEEIAMSTIAVYATDQAVGPLSAESVREMTEKTLRTAMRHGLLKNLKVAEAPAEEPAWTKNARRAVVGGDPNAN